MHRVAILICALLGACSTMAQVPAAPGSGQCNDAGLAEFIGQEASAELGARMQARSGAKVLRWVAYGTMITMDFSAERLTVSLDRQNWVEAARCG